MSLTFAGYAALFDCADRAGDVTRCGAFGPPRDVPLLWQHRGRAVGRVVAEENARGLRVAGEIDDPELARLVRTGTVRGLSVGYRPRIVHQGARRELHRVDLVEVSLVTVPMQPHAMVDTIG